MANNSGLSKRAALRQQQELEDRRKRNSRILGFGLGGVGLVVVVILAIVIIQTLGQNQEQTANQQTPPNATEGYGIEIVSKDVQPAEDVPHVVAYEDYQCPHCAEYEAAYGPMFEQLIDSGQITMEIRNATFMEVNMMNDASTNAARAAAAADAVGKYREYHSHVFSQQSTSGAGYSDQQLRVDFPAAVGIEGEDLTKFQELYDSQAFAQFVEDSDNAFANSGATGTPAYYVGDEKFDPAGQTSAEGLLQVIQTAAG